MFSRTLFRRILTLTAISTQNILCAEKKRREVYIWGNGVYQARPDAILQFKNFTPKIIKNLPNDLVCLEFGDYYEAGIDSKGQLYVWDNKVLDANMDDRNKDDERQNIRCLEKEGIKEVKFTQGYIWAVTTNNKVYQWPIIKDFDSQNRVISTSIGSKREVQPLKGIVQLSTGTDHILALNTKGQILAMGDDTLGQCGQCDTDRHTHPPFTERRVKFPTKVKNLPKIKKVIAGGNHSLALDQNGNLYGWGSNSTVQLSHQQEHSAMNKPLLCSYVPLKISKNLDNGMILDVVAGQQFTFVVTKNRGTENCETFSFGNNLRGQLGINQMRHLKDITRVQSLSNYVMKVEGESSKVSVDQIKCGDRHCIALLNIGYIMEWGDNQCGQMGNKKRSSAMSPIIMKYFVGKKVVYVFAGKTNSAVIVETNEE